ncbi:hypothetical protein B296_00058883 [Ensete ventricosum]|uniref:Uncharacterized protein n=1 Tax=Ensete ventricosum TaxID=4639 RepID=A0A426WZQ5_ENSVE|nr:hypothetical protein B296_00058883 [Ensete ventricosum]
MRALAVSCRPRNRLATADRRVEFARERTSGNTKCGRPPETERAWREDSGVPAAPTARKRRKRKKEAAAPRSLERAMEIRDGTPLAAAAGRRKLAERGEERRGREKEMIVLEKSLRRGP